MNYQGMQHHLIFACTLLLLSTVNNFLHADCIAVGQSCCQVTQNSVTATVDSLPGSLVFSSQGCFSVIQTNQIATYPIDQTTCSLQTPLLTPFLDGLGLAYSPSGSCLMAFNGEGQVVTYSANNCTLTSVGSPLANLEPNSLAISSNNCFTIGQCDSARHRYFKWMRYKFI